MAPTTLTPMASSLLRSSRLAVRPAMASLRAPAAVRYSSHDHHGPQVTEPPLLTWGVPAGQKRPKEAWEGPFKFFVAGFVMFALMGWLRPDTSRDDEYKAEALKRLQASDLKWWYEPSPYSIYYGRPEFYPPGVPVPEKKKPSFLLSEPAEGH